MPAPVPSSAAPAVAAKPVVLIIDDDAEVRYSIHRVLAARDYVVHTASSGAEGIETARALAPAVVFLDNRMEGMSGLETLQHLRSRVPRAMVVLMTAYGTTQTAIEAMKFGAFDYIVKPFDIKKILTLAANAAKASEDLGRAEGTYTPLLNSEDYKEGMVGQSEAMQEVFKVIGQVAASNVTVMITGESGTGKELVARSLWQHSLRANKPFIAVNCAAIPENMIESELFGHEKGSFTGAVQQRIGKFEQSDGGTIFLDEIGDMALATQTKILRALQEGEIQRVGGSETLQVDVRMVAATNKDLEKMVAEKTFREDLYYRLNVVRLRLPALRERIEDLPLLVDFMLQRLQRGRKGKMKSIAREALDVLQRHRWPGNVRELENVITRSAIVAQGDTILVKDLPREIREAAGLGPTATSLPLAMSATLPAAPGSDSEPPFGIPAPAPAPASAANAVTVPVATPALPTAEAEEPTTAANEGPGETAGTAPAMDVNGAMDLLYAALRRETDTDLLGRVEAELIRRVLHETAGNQLRASALLGMTRATLRKRLDELGLRLDGSLRQGG